VWASGAESGDTDLIELHRHLEALNTQLAEYQSLRNLLEERKEAINALKTIIETIKGSESQESMVQSPISKRTCRLRLGGHCMTEALDKAASQYWYLKSPHSPGR